MKLHILYPFTEQPYGGGNQFLKALRAELQRQACYAPTMQTANAILINLNPGSLPALYQRLPMIKRVDPGLPIIGRVDGPISLIRGHKYHRVDRHTARLINMFVDALVFQSQWSKNQNERMFAITAPHASVIFNATDPTIFTKSRRLPSTGGKIRIIATSWSANPAKGFDVYAYLDQHLDFSRFDMTFIGNSPISFSQIRSQRPLGSKQLAAQLQQHHLYLTASQNDPCSNSLIEAMSCGLPVIARRSGGHPELVQQGGVLYDGPDDVLSAIETMACNLNHYQQHLPTQSIADVARQYLGLAQRAAVSPNRKRYSLGQHIQSLGYGLTARIGR